MNIRAKLNKYTVAKNASVMALAQIVSRVAMIVYLGALARHVGAEGIGQISTANALNAMLLLVVGPGLTILLVRDVAGERDRAGQYLTNAIFLRLLLLVPFIALTTAIAHLSNYPLETIRIIHIYTVVYILDTLGEVLIAGFRAYERMELEAALQLIRDFTNIGLSLVGIALGWPLINIVMISVVAQLVKFLLSAFWLSRYIVRLKPKFNLTFSKHLLLASVPFGLLLIIQTLQQEFGTYLLSLHVSAELVGIYGAANTLILMLLYVPNSFAAAIFPNLSRLSKESKFKLRRFYQVSYKYLLVLGFPLGVGTFLVGSRAIMLVYGDEFAAATPVIRIMSVFLFTIVGYANGALLYATDRQKFYAWTQTLAAILNSALGIVLIPRLGPVGAATAFAASGILTFFVHSIACHRSLDLSMPWGVMARVLAAALVMGLALHGAMLAGLPWVPAAVFVAPGVYAAMLFLFGLVNRDELRTLGGAPIDIEDARYLPAAAAADARPSA